MKKKHGWLSNVIGCVAAAVVLFFVNDVGALLSDIRSVIGLGAGEQVSCVSQDRYVHGTLDEEHQLVYDQMLDAIMNFREEAQLSATSQEDVELCYNAICADYGEIFWMDGCSYRVITLFGKPCAVSFQANYTCTRQEAADYQAQMQPQIDLYLELLEDCDSDYEKTLTLYESLITDVAYDLSAENNQNILSVFLGKKTVCQGYASAAQYLLQQAGIETAIVAGEARRQPHAWNLVKLDGEYYYLDVTWGNAVASGEAAQATAAMDYSGINYGYLNITGEELETNHEPQVDFVLPECTATADNYYIQNDSLFDVWDADVIGGRFGEAYAAGAGELAVKFTDADLLKRAVQELITDQGLADYCEGLTQIYYMMDEDLHILTICFEREA